MYSNLSQYSNQYLIQYSDQHQKLIQHIPANVHAALNQRMLIKLLEDCRQANPLKTQETM